mmetsp:Transcript_13347/g.20605  ORF Transcript_13347/g.20605 Transcript_13347/m.20605 type:complete len:487 (+) Transcript_13347:96-1556(+)
MASFISTVKRKLSALLSLGSTPSDEAVELDGEMLSFAEGRPRKRRRQEGTQTPMLRWEGTQTQLSTPHLEPTDSILVPPAFTLCHDIVSTSEGAVVNKSKVKSELLRLSNDVLSRCLSYISTKSDRFSLQTTCTTFRRLSDCDEMLANINLGGDWNTQQTSNVPVIDNNNFILPSLERGGNNQNADDIDVREMTIAFPHGRSAVATDNCGIITDSDTSITACNKLIKYAAAGNMQAVYMIAMILCYCHENISEGIALLRLAREAGHLPSTYALALILRDSRPVESDYCLDIAAEKNYPPAWQEKLSATEMRLKFGGDLDASKLIHYLDPPCLIRLLGRHYLECQRVRKNQTSHCWNILCGRWAYRAVPSTPPRPQDQRGYVHGLLVPFDANDAIIGSYHNRQRAFSIESLLPQSPTRATRVDDGSLLTPLQKIKACLESKPHTRSPGLKVSRMKMCSSCRRAKYCSKLCQTYDWRSGRHKMECQFL